MSGYFDDEPRRRSHRTSRRPVYEEEVIETRNPRPSRQMDLIPRRDSDDSVEEVRRDFAPGDGTYVSRRVATRDRFNPPAPRSSGRSTYYSEDDHHGDRRRRRNRESMTISPVRSYVNNPNQVALGMTRIPILSPLAVRPGVANAASRSESRRSRPWV